MPVPSILKSLTVAGAVLVASAAALAQTSVTTEPAGKQNNSATPTSPSGTSGKAPAQRSAEKSMAAKTDPSPTASKQNDSKTPLPESKTGGKTTAQRDAEKTTK